MSDDRQSPSALAPTTVDPARADVVVLGEVLVELSSTEPLREGASLRLGFSGDALNVAAAAAAAGARTTLVARIPDDELGDDLVRRIASLGIDTRQLRRVAGQHGLYLTHADPDGERHFLYARSGSVGSSLAPADLNHDLLAGAGVVVASGVACAVSGSAASAVLAAAELAPTFVYDPNLRPRLTTPDAARALLRRLAPLAAVVTPSWPTEARLLLGTDVADPGAALDALWRLGPAAVVMTRGADGALVRDDSGVIAVPGVPALNVVDQTGAGDCFTGTLAARLALGDPLVEAVRLGTAAASLSVGGQGGLGFVPTLEQTRVALSNAPSPTPGRA
ncbi:MAG: PfkB family carbohydrate kinase [Terracoccus sp.]